MCSHALQAQFAGAIAPPKGDTISSNSILFFGTEAITLPLTGWALRSMANMSHLRAQGQVTYEPLFPDGGMATNPARPTVAILPPSILARALDLVARTRPRFVILDRGVMLLDLAQALADRFPDLPLVFDFHNIESALYAEILTDRPTARHLGAQGDAQAGTRAADKKAAELADAVMVCSENDAALLQTFAPTARVVVVPNPIPPTRPLPPPAPGITRILFVGMLSYAPNRSAVVFMLTRLLPLLVPVLPRARIVIAGRNPGRKFTLAARLLPWVELHANLPDLEPVYRAASVCVMPLRSGGGTRLKALEALGFSRPVIATAKAVEGLGLTPEQDYLRAETALQFLRAILRLHRDPALCARLVASGRTAAQMVAGDSVREAALALAVSRALAARIH